MKQINFFILYKGFFTFLNSFGAQPIDLAYVSSILSGFIAKVGKLIPINDPVVKNFLITNPIILEVLLFHY